MKDYLTAIVIPFYPIPQKKSYHIPRFWCNSPVKSPIFPSIFGCLLKKAWSHFDSKKLTSAGGKKNLGWGSILDEWRPIWGGTDPKAWRMHPQAEGEWMGWRGWRGRKEVSSLKTQENPQLVKWGMNMNGREMKWQLLNQPIHFQGRSVGVHVFFVVGLMCGGWMVRISIACIFCCKVDRVATFESACPSLCKEINYLSTESVFSKFLWTQLGHLGCWFELPGQDSINIMWLACTFLVEGYDYFFFGGGSYWHQRWMCTNHAYWLPDYPGVRRTGRETREPIRCSVVPSMVLPALVPASCRTKSLLQWGI